MKLIVAVAIFSLIIISLMVKPGLPVGTAAIDSTKSSARQLEKKLSNSTNQKTESVEINAAQIDQENPDNSLDIVPLDVNDDLLDLSLAAVRSEDPSLAYDAFSILIDLSAEESSRILREIINQQKTNVYFDEMVFIGMMNLQKNTNLLTDDDVQTIYQRGNDSVKKLAAKIMKDRGNDSLANDYVKLMDYRFLNVDSSIRLQTLFDISAIAEFDSLPKIRQFLNDSDDSVRLQALNLLGTYGNDMDISAAESLLGDSHPQVRAQAQLVVKNLWHKNSHHVMTENQEFAPPGDLY